MSIITVLTAITVVTLLILRGLSLAARRTQPGGLWRNRCVAGLNAVLARHKQPTIPE